MQVSNDIIGVRAAARAYEQALPTDQRKRFGRFFTGVALGKVLAALALTEQTRTVLDPMAGHGDLLDATAEIAAVRGIPLQTLAGIEIDASTADVCRERLSSLLASENAPSQIILTGSAFEQAQINALPTSSFDLVIANPPYVRFQGRNDDGSDPVRSGLSCIVEVSPLKPTREIWRTLADGYSGLADLSVPSWLLAGHLVRPGGRIAIVAPATWRSRDYADVIRYLLLRCFEIEFIVEDTQPGWFSDALVRTHLIVARRLELDEAATPLTERGTFSRAKRLRIAPDAANEVSLLGNAFSGSDPEVDFAAWARSDNMSAHPSIEIKPFDLRDEWLALLARIEKHRWCSKVENSSNELSLFASRQDTVCAALPEPLRELMPSAVTPFNLVSLEELGINVGQGLRTGCNSFFYADAIGPAAAGLVTIQLSEAFSGTQIEVPEDILRPVLRRQAELDPLDQGVLPAGRVLDLRDWILPEEAQDAARCLLGEQMRRIMPGALAEHVRGAAKTKHAGSNKLIPELSAVRTNARKAGKGGAAPRYWYMLPDFAPRHLPLAFTPRINHGTPWIECNVDKPLLIDANFSTFWSRDMGWTQHALKALLNSVWCRTFMEALGTPMGGGALKLEATHLRQLSVPRLGDDDKRLLDEAGKKLTRENHAAQKQIDEVVLQAIIADGGDNSLVATLAGNFKEQAELMRLARQRVAA